MSFFRRLFGLESQDQKLQRRLQEQKDKIVTILRKDGRANEEILKQIEDVLFTPDTIIDVINDLLKTQALNQEAQQALDETKEETQEIIAELGYSSPVTATNEDVQEIIDETPQTNATLLTEITNNLSTMIGEISENNKRIANMEQRLKVLKQDTAEIDQVISELKIKLDRTQDLEEKKKLIEQIETLEADKEIIDASAESIKNKILAIQKLVADQSAQLANFQQGSGRHKYINKINKMTRKELDAIAKTMNLTPSNYKTKKDIQDAVKLITLARKLPLKKLDKQRLAVISQNYGITSKSKKGMLEDLKKYKLIK